MLNWNDLKTLLYIAEAGTLSGASRLSNVSQPTLTRRLSELELEVGDKLFERRKDGYHLTETGELVLAHAQRVKAEIAGILECTNSANQLQGRIAITANAGFSANCLVPILSNFQSLYPEVSFDLITSYTRLNVTRKEADIAIRLGNSKHANLERHRLGKVQFGLYAASAYLAEFGEPENLQDLPKQKIIGSQGEVAELMQNKMLLDLQQDAQVGFSTDSFTDQIAATRQGLGIMTAAAYMMAKEPLIQRILPEQFCPELDLWLIASKNYVLSSRTKLLFNYLKEHIPNVPGISRS